MESRAERTAPESVKPAKKSKAQKNAVRRDKRATKALLDTPEVQALIARAVEQKVEHLLDKLASKRSETGTVSGQGEDGDRRLIEHLALAIVETSNQGKRKIVAPEELSARNAAREKMENLILDARAKGEVPTYELKRAVYFDELLVEATYVGSDHVRRAQRIEWPGVPNEYTLPVNDVAKGIFEQFMRSIGGSTGQNVVPYSRASQRYGTGLKVVGQEMRAPEPPQVGRPRMADGGLKVLREAAPGQIVETNVLGTVAAPARQIA